MRDRLNIYRIAGETGVSIATVSRVLNNKPNVSTQTRRQVMQCISRLKYVPRLYRNRAPLLGVVLERSSSIFSNYVSELINGVTDFATESGLALTIFSLFEKEVTAHGLVSYLRGNSIGGLVVLLSNSNSHYLLDLQKERIPCVALNNRYERKINFIDVDDEKGIRLAMMHLAAQGHRRVAYVGGSLVRDNFQRRLESYRENVKSLGLVADPALVRSEDRENVHPNHLDDGYAKTLELLSGRSAFSAVVCASDEFAFGTIKALIESGRRVPGDVSVVGFDDCMISSYFQPALTTVRQPLRKMGYLAAQEISRSMDLSRIRPREGSKAFKLKTVLEPELIVRSSTNRAPEGGRSSGGR